MIKFKVESWNGTSEVVIADYYRVEVIGGYTILKLYKTKEDEYPSSEFVKGFSMANIKSFERTKEQDVN